jgi:hypothetical protein
MTPGQTTADAPGRQGPARRTREDAARAFDDFSDPFSPPFSQRRYAAERGLPRSTLGDWLRRPGPDGLEPDLGAFLRGAAGERFLRRLVLACLLVFHQQGACGLRLVGSFLALVGLDRFVGASYGALHRLAARLQAELAAFGDEEQRRLAPLMPHRAIALVADENFHGPDACLVAIEPCANFILVEAYHARRDGATWAQELGQATEGLPVEVVALTSDQAKGLLACAGRLQARHTPELFHGQRDLARPLSGALRRQTASAQKELDRAAGLTEHWRQRQRQAQAAPPGPGRPTDFEWRLVLAEGQERDAARQLEACQQRQQQAREALRGVADDYHPFDGQTGQPVQAEQVQARLEERVKALRGLSRLAGLGLAGEEALEKGRHWLGALVASLAWFWAVARRRVEGLSLPAEAEAAVYEKLLPGLYWQQAARRQRTPEQRRQKRQLAERLLAEARARGGALGSLAKAEREQLERVAREVVGLFSRSSSCVEGRNGRLALLHHGHTRLSAARLKALTVVHNYVVRRPDGSTAAERFFGAKQRDAFDWLLLQMPELPRPAAKRAKQGPLQPAKAG